MTAPTAVGTLAKTAIEAGRAFGVSEDRITSILDQLSLDAKALADDDSRIAVEDLLRLWDLIAINSGDYFFGLHAGERIVSARTIHVVGFAACSSPTLGECFEYTARFASLTNESSEIAVVVKGARGSVICNPKPGLPAWPRVYAEMAMAAYYTNCQRWTGQVIRPHLVTFQHAKPDDTSEYERMFECPLQFNAPKNCLVLPASTFALPFNVVEPALLAYFREKATMLLDNVASSTIEQRVREEIFKTLAGATPTIAAVARRLGFSARTLQRRLAEQDLQFAQLVDDVRRIQALRLMAARDTDIAMVAFRVGYRDLDAFRAAFQRWTGMTPRAYRQT